MYITIFLVKGIGLIPHGPVGRHVQLPVVLRTAIGICPVISLAVKPSNISASTMKPKLNPAPKFLVMVWNLFKNLYLQYFPVLFIILSFCFSVTVM